MIRDTSATDRTLAPESGPTDRRRLLAIGAGVLLTCLAESITREDVEALARGIIAWHKELAPAGDTTRVFRDSSFADDVEKSNLSALLFQHGIENEEGQGTC